MTLPTPRIADVKFRFGGHQSHSVTCKAEFEFSGYDLFAKVNDGPEFTGWLERSQEQADIRFAKPLEAGDVVEVTAQAIRLGGKGQQEILEVSERSAPQRFVYSGSNRFTGGKLNPVEYAE